MSEANSYGFGGKLIAAIILALLGGYIWACIEKGQSPLAILKMFSSEEESAPAKAAAPKKEAPKPEPITAKKPEPVKAPETVIAKKPDPVVAPAGPKTYSSIEMGILFNDADDLLRRGKLFEARDKIQNASRLMVPQESLGQFANYEARVGRYHSLLLETSKGGTIEMPKMTQVLIKDAGKLVVKVLSEDRDFLTYETLTGIRSRVRKASCEDIKALEPVYARVEVSLELKKQADYKGLIVEQDPGKPLTLKEKPGRKATSLQIFDLADFCARNGANDKLVPLFDEALARDPDLINTVHEAKAERMVDVLLYFLSIKATSDARRTLDVLKERYAESAAYKKQVASDTEFISMMESALTRKPAPGPIAKIDVQGLPPKPAEPRTNPPAPASEEPKPGNPPPSRPDPPDAALRTEPGVPGETTSIPMPDGTNSKILALVAKGDGYFRQAMEHLNNCDPRVRPEESRAESKKALKLFMQANAEGYGLAQDEYKDGARVPEALLDRFKETQQRAFFCRKFGK